MKVDKKMVSEEESKVTLEFIALIKKIMKKNKKSLKELAKH